MVGTRTLLGLAIDEFGIVMAELRSRPGGSDIRRSAQFAFSEALTKDNAAPLGQDLKQFLRTNHFSAKHAIVGVSTKWIVAKEIVVPPAGSDALAGMLTIQAERAFSLNASELIFDYSGRVSSSESSRVMLLAARREIVNQIKDLAAAAGLQIEAVTVSAMAFSRALSKLGAEQRYGLYMRPNYCEFWSQAANRLQNITHVPLGSPNGADSGRAEALTSALRRQILLLAQRNQAPPYDVTLYDSCDLADGVIDQLNDQLKPQAMVRDGNPGVLAGGGRSADQLEDVQAVAAAAIAMIGLAPDRPAVDFLNPRIGGKKASPHKRVVTYVVAAVVLVLALVGALVAQAVGLRRDIAMLSAELKAKQAQIDVARETVERDAFAAPWTSQRPQFLEGLRQLTLAFPERPRVWATSLSIGEAGDGALVGKASDESSFYEMLDKIKENGAFANVRMSHLRNAGRDSSEKDFSVLFNLRGVE